MDTEKQHNIEKYNKIIKFHFRGKNRDENSGDFD